MSRAVLRTWLNVEYLSRSAQNQNITISRRFVCLFRAKTKIKRKERKQENSLKEIPSPLVVPVFPRRTKEKSRSIFKLFITTGIKLHLKPLVQTVVFGR